MTLTNKTPAERLRDLLVLTTSAGALAISTAAAQVVEAVEAEDDEVEQITEVDRSDFEADGDSDTIVVTGSRLRRDEFNTISPIQVITGEVSRDLGLVDADEVLRQTSVVQGQQTTIGLSTTLATGQAFTTFGSVTPSLRGLSSSVTGRTRNLFLVNGRRLGPTGVGGAPSNVDVSLIPGTLIEGVDILLDGASSVYGSDAIAGVINYRLRDDFDGFEVDAFYDKPLYINDAGDQLILSATAGTTGERGNFLIAAELNKQNGIRRIDRFDRYAPFIENDFGTVACNPEREINEATGEVFSGCVGGLSGFGVFGPSGTFFPTPGQTNLGIPGWSRLGLAPFDGDDSAGTFGSINNPFTRFFPTDQQAHVLPETQRISVYSIGSYETDLPTNAEFFYEMSYAERELRTESFAQGVIEVTDQTPGNPGLGSALLVPLLRFENDQNVDQFRLTGGVRGDLDALSKFGLNNWVYEGYGLFHRSRGTTKTFGDINNINLARVLNGTYDSNGQFECALDELIQGQQPTRNGTGGFTTPVPNCDGFNLFDPQFLLGGRFTDPAANDFFLTTVIQDTLVEQVTWNGFVTGDLFDIPNGGTAAAVLGAEYRHDSVDTTNDYFQSTSNALATLNPDVGSLGDRRILEGFGELSLPLIRDSFGVKAFDVELAARFTDEEFAGSAWTWQAKGALSPTDFLTFSAGVGTSFRAPDTGEQFGTGIIFANNTRIDPCLPSTNTLETAPTGGITVDGVPIPGDTVYYDATQDERDAGVIALCQQLGVQLPSGPLDVNGAAALGLFGIGTPSGSFQNFSVLFGNDGDPNVEPEESKAFFAKVTFEQPWVDWIDVDFSVNYFAYEVTGTIAQLTAGTIINECFGAQAVQDGRTSVVNGVAVGTFCEFLTRDPATGLLTAINEASANLGDLKSEGFDFNLSIDGDLPYVEKFMGSPVAASLVYRATQQIRNDEDVSGDGNFAESAGEFGFPRYQHNITTSLDWENWRLSHRMFFSSRTDVGIAPFGGANVCAPALLDRDPNADTSGCTEYIELPDVKLHDIVLSYRGDTFAVRAGVRNVLDEVIIRDTAIPGDGDTGTPFGLGYDLDGRNVFVNLTKSF